MIHFICSYFNFGNSTKIRNNYIKFRRNFKYDITTVELALPDQQFFIDDSIKLAVDYNNILWQKERCLNIAIEESKRGTDAIAWIDTDVIFDNPNLLRDTEEALEKWKVVQMFEKVYETPTVNDFFNNYSLGKQMVDELDISYPNIGLAWAFRRDILVDDKLYDLDPVGNSDVLQLMAWLGQWNNSCITNLLPQYRKEFLLWAWDSYENVQGDIGYVKGALEHIYHGKQENRKYRHRNQILIDNNYVPSKDLRMDHNQLYTLPYCPQMVDDIRQYFNLRSQSE